jgi:CHC2 zinc finger
MIIDDGRRDQALAMDMAEVLNRLRLDETLKRAGVEWTGPCPQCGGNDRFSVNTRKGKFNCRICGAKGDVIGLVRHVRGCTFPEALDFLCGPAVQMTAAEKQAAAEKREQQQRDRDEKAAQLRADSIARGRKIWVQGLAAEGTMVRDYLRRRGIPDAALPVLPRSLRFHPDLPYWQKMADGRYRVLHRGPAMLAAVQGADGRFTGCHRTWIDLDQPKGRLRLVHPETGAELKTKKTEGSKKGGAIRLRGPVPVDGTTMVMGEGIETTATAMAVDMYPGAAYWAGVDLGNMAGQMRPVVGVRTSGLPDMTDLQAFVPPPWVTRLIFIQDGDSDPVATFAKLRSGLIRAQLLRPGLVAQIVHAGAGVDLNDLLMRPSHDG